jgi:ATP-dependent DNA ligase
LNKSRPNPRLLSLSTLIAACSIKEECCGVCVPSPISSNLACRALLSRPPADPDWIHEIKHDGFRARWDAQRVRLFTRNGHDWTERYPLMVLYSL